MAAIFNGREFAARKEVVLKSKVADLKKKGVTPKLVSILVGDNPGSILYTSLKKKAAERIGAELEVRRWKSEVGYRSLIDEIKRLNGDKKVHGIMVQMPLPKEIVNYKLSIINSIALEKDVDGLREDSPYLPATVKAIVEIIQQSNKELKRKKIVVVGSEGMVGSRLVRQLKLQKFRVVGIDLNTRYQIQDTKFADILISTTGVPGLIKADMVKKGAVVIDVGAPKGDVRFDEVAKKTSFITPVPGGVGPVTIVSLLDNLLIAAKNLVK